MKNSWFDIRAEASTDSVEVYIRDEIDPYYGVGAKQFIEALSPHKDKTITMRVHSPGGSVFEGLAIADFISGLNVTAIVEGMAASAAAIIVAKAKKTIISENGAIMIHGVSGGAFGNAETLESTAELMARIDERQVKIFAKRTGKTEEEIQKMLTAETWFFGEEAVEAGFADEVSDQIALAAKAWPILKTFKNVPAIVASTAELVTEDLEINPLPQKTNGLTSKNSDRKKVNPEKNTIMKKLMAFLCLQKLIPSESLDDENATTLFTAAWEKLQAGFEKSKTKIADLTAEVEKLKLEAIQKEGESVIEAAIKDRKIKDTPELRSKWIAAYVKDPEGLVSMLSDIEVVAVKKPALGGDPLIEGDDLNPDDTGGTLDTLEACQAAMKVETDTDKKWALGLKCREFRGRPELFK